MQTSVLPSLKQVNGQVHIMTGTFSYMFGLNAKYQSFYLEKNSPSKLPCSSACFTREVYVSFDGTNTKTPLLKQSGQPISGAADSSSLSNSSSTF